MRFSDIICLWLIAEESGTLPRSASGRRALTGVNVEGDSMARPTDQFEPAIDAAK
jgi:hypothetical protein